MALTPEQMQVLNNNRLLAAQQAASGNWGGPLTIDASAGNVLRLSDSPYLINPNWNLYNAAYYFDPQYQWDGGTYSRAYQIYDEPTGEMQTRYQRYAPTANNPTTINDVGLANGQTDVPDYQYVLSPEEMQQAWNTNRGLSPLTLDQFKSAYQYVTNSPVYDFVDLYGRVISPGTQIKVNGGSFTYNPTQPIRSKTERPKDGSDYDYFGAVEDWTAPYDWQTDGNRYLPQNNPDSWTWTPDKAGTPNPGLDALEGTIFTQQQFGGTIGEGGWSAIKGLGSTLVGPVLGAIAAEAGAATTATSQSLTLADYISNGATWAEMLDAGFSPAQIVMAGGTVPATSASLSDATGLSGGVSSALTNTAANALQGATQSAILGKDPLQGAIKGGIGSGMSGLVNYALKNMGNVFTSTPAYGGNDMANDMDMSDMTMYDGGSYPSYDATGYLGNMTGSTGGSWLDGIDWGKLATTVLPTVSGIAGGLLANNAQNNAINAAQAQTAAGLANQQAMYQQQRADFAPYAALGLGGVAQYANFAADPSAYLKSPAYAWMKGEIDKNMNRQLSARGRSNSTYGMQALGNAYGNLAATEYNNAYNRMLDPIKIGQGAAAATGNAASNMSNNYGAYAQNQAALANQQGNANASLYSGLGAMPQNLVNYYNQQNMNQQMLNALTKSQGGM